MGVGNSSMKPASRGSGAAPYTAATDNLSAPARDREVLAMDLASVVKELVAVLGGPNVAVIGGVSKTSLVAEWGRGVRPKSEDRAVRLRLALRLSRIIGARYSPEVVRA